MKENCFEASSALRHMCELGSYKENNKPILILYTDGGSDHRLTFMSVKLSLIAYFLEHDKDMLIAVRTPPYNSWKDPAERVMSILNIGLNSVGLMRGGADEDVEDLLASRKNMKEIRALAEDKPHVQEAVRESIKPVKELLRNLFQRLALKDKEFKVFSSCSEEDIVELWEEISKVDDSLTRTDTSNEKIKDKVFLQSFMANHCVDRQYSFQIKKRGNTNCVCGDVRLPPDVFATLSHLPDPVPDGTGHYKSFNELYG